MAITITPSYIRNVGKISFTFKDEGIYGKMLNQCRLDTWKYVVDRHDINLNETLIDFGCSHGAYAENWREIGFKNVIGVDVNPNVISAAQKALGDARLIKDQTLLQTTGHASIVAANGVFCHILEEQENIEALKSMAETATDKVIFTAYECRYFMDSGRKERVGSESCERYVETYRKFINIAGLEILDEVGSFITPWGIPGLEYTAYDDELRENWDFHRTFVDMSKQLRGKSLIPFTEIMFVTRKK